MGGGGVITCRNVGPSYHGSFGDFSRTLVAVSAESGTKMTSFFVLYPQPLRKGVSFSTHSSKRSCQPQTRQGCVVELSRATGPLWVVPGPTPILQSAAAGGNDRRRDYLGAQTDKTEARGAGRSAWRGAKTGAEALACLREVDGRVVHLVDGDDEDAHAERLGEQRVLARLAAAVEARLELALARRDDEDADVGLARARNHVGNVVLVAGRVEDRVPAESGHGGGRRGGGEVWVRRRRWWDATSSGTSCGCAGRRHATSAPWQRQAQGGREGDGGGRRRVVARTA